MAGTLWRGAVVGLAAGAAQVAFSLPAAQYSGLDTRQRVPLVILAVLIGVPVSGLVVGGLTARWLRLPVLVAVVGVVLTAGLAMVTVWLGVPHLPVATDPGVWFFGAACAVPGYAAAALIVVPPWRAWRCAGVLAAAVALTVAGSLAWLEVAYALRARTLADTGGPLVAADIPGYHLRDVTVTDRTELSYVRSSGEVIDVSVRPDRGLPRDCAGARAVLGRHAADYPCRDLDDRWVVEIPGGLAVVATHAGTAVVLSGTAPEMERATLRTASARELAEAAPGRS